MDQNPTLRNAAAAAAALLVVVWYLKNGKPRDKKLRYPEGPLNPSDPSKDKIDAIFNKLKTAFEQKVTSKICDRGRWDYEHRMQQLYGLRALVLENGDAIYAAAKADVGRTKGEAVIEYGASIAELDCVIANLRAWMRKDKRGTPLWMMPSESYILYEPLGVCLILGTWNYSVMTSILPVAGALAAGNTIILKPSEVAPAQSALMAKLLPKYIDPEMLQIIEGGPSVSQTLVDGYEWGKVFYTGGGKIGAQIGVSCAARHIPVALELGGKSPTVILDDADLVVSCRRIVQGKWVNSGQTCIAPDYVLIVGDEKRQKQVTEALLAEVRKQYPGDVSKYNEYARIVNERHFERVQGLLKSGGKVIHGGKSDKSQKFIEPTLLVDCPNDAAIMQEEIFGPLLPILYFKSISDVVSFIRARPKPLALYVFGQSSKKIDQVVSQTTAGSCCVNESVFQYLNPYLPFGGIGPSGVGSYHGRSSFLGFSHGKSVMARSTFGDLFFRYLPYLQEKWVQDLFSFLLVL